MNDAGLQKKRVATDWGQIRQRLEDARTALEKGWTPGHVEIQRILKARAKALAREPAKTHADDQTVEIVEFVLAYEKYVIEAQYVREVYPLENLTPLPCTPAFVLGVVNVRGEILSVIDLKKFFDLPEKGLTDLNKVIVLQSEGMIFGILADAVLDVRRISLTEIQPSLPTLIGVRDRYLRGITPERAVFLDVEKLLTDEQIIVHEQV